MVSINYEDLEIDHNAESVYHIVTGISSGLREKESKESRPGTELSSNKLPTTFSISDGR
jgi:hypothetical protein